VDVGEEGQQAEHGNDLELDLLGFVRHALRQGVQAQEHKSDGQNGEDQNHGHRRHEDVRVLRAGNERRQMLGRGGVEGCIHQGLPRGARQAWTTIPALLVGPCSEP
jgi:hypothetical protein